ncbi:MAG TPA: hypothetical protein VFO62_12645 [Candidatus Binatia bacterium]|nr:hypothetical protein [Candidatus Binatia bacterium]
MPLQPSAQPRSATVTTFAWLVILASVALIPISFITLLMILVGSYGTESASLLGFLNVVVAPPVTLAAGIGLLRRKPWARHYLLALFSVILTYNVYAFARAAPEPSHYVSPSGVPTTVLPTDRTMFVPIIVVAVVALAVLLSRRVRRDFVAAPSSPVAPAATTPAPVHASRDWRVGHVGRDRMYYEEWRDGAWHRLDIDGEMLTGNAHHAVYLASPERWSDYPAWAHHRRDEIIARIKSELREPDYEYSSSGGIPTATAMTTSTATTATRSRSRQRPGPLLAVALLLALAGGMGWLVYDGIGTGETLLPLKSPSQRRSVLRADEPALFWVSIGLYATVALGAVGLVGWGIAQTRREK